MNSTRFPLGRIPDIADQRDKVFRRPAPKAVAKLPATLDLRTKDFGITDQGQLGSCTGHGSTGAFRNSLRFLGLSDWTASRLAAYYFARSFEGTTGEDAGAMIRDAMKGIHNFGALDEAVWPYSEDRFAIKPTAPAIATGKKHIGLQYQRVDTTDWEAVKAALALHGNLTIGISVYDSFMSDKVAKTGTVPLPGIKEQLQGGHCIRAVGYTSTLLRCANSWGTGWGAKGYFTLPKAYVTSMKLCDDAWCWVLTE